jgi:1,4-dihydroxy-2-naphthoate octaprenyltransferase
MQDSPSVLKAYISASRPKTWIAGISPVLIGTVLAAKEGSISLPLFTCCILFSLLIQIGTNFANDYFDYINGADENRVGPPRATTLGWIQPEQMKTAYVTLFIGAFFASIPLIAVCGIWALCFVLSSIAFGIFYTGGGKPLGYMGLGDILVLIYFGPVAVAGTYFVQQHTIPPLLLTLAPGFLCCAILTANNLRDEQTDRISKKNTLVVRFGKTFGRWEYATCIFLAAIIPVFYGIYFPLLILPLSIPLLKQAFTYTSPQEAIPLLPQTALLLIFFTALFCL